MNRRELFHSVPFGLLSIFALRGIEAFPEAAIADPFQLTSALTNDQMRQLETVAAGSGQLQSARPSATVVVPIYFDESKQTFVRSRMVTPTLDVKQYTMTATLRGSRISQSSLDALKDSNLQVNFNVGVPSSEDPQDKLTWLIMSGIDVFGDPKNLSSNLVSFDKGASLTGALDTGQGIAVNKGRLTMGIELFGHKKESWWQKALRIGKAIANTPIFGQIGLPMLAKQALDFTTSALNKISQNDQLVSLLQSPPISYTVQSGLNTPIDRYKLRDGLWVAVDLNKAEATDYLKDYEIDIDNPLLPVRQKSSHAPLDADYMVVEFGFNSKAA